MLFVTFYTRIQTFDSSILLKNLSLTIVLIKCARSPFSTSSSQMAGLVLVVRPAGVI